MLSRQVTINLQRVVRSLAMLLTVLIFAGPLAWFATLSLKHTLDIFTTPPTLWKFSPTLDNYTALFSAGTHFQTYIINSLIVAGASTAIAVPAGAAAAYALARKRVTHAGGWSFAMLVFRMLPPVSLVVPYYLVFLELHLLGSLVAITLTHTIISLPIVIWLLKGFFEEVPYEIEQAAQVDGCTPWQTLTRIVIPMSLASVVAAGVFSFLTSWNEFLFASVLSNPDTQTLTVAGSTFVGEVYISWGELAAATTIGIVPAVVFTLAGQRFLLRGLAPGAVK